MSRHRSVVLEFVLLGAAIVACQGPVFPGQHGAYHRQNKTLHLSTGEAFVVFRVKYWEFDDGSPPALQLEAEPGLLLATRHGCTTSRSESGPSFCPMWRLQAST